MARKWPGRVKVGKFPKMQIPHFPHVQKPEKSGSAMRFKLGIRCTPRDFERMDCIQICDGIGSETVERNKCVEVAEMGIRYHSLVQNDRTCPKWPK